MRVSPAAYFGALHARLHDLYHGVACACPDCGGQRAQLAGGRAARTKPVEDAAKAAYDHLHKRGAYTPADLDSQEPYKDLIAATKAAIQPAITDSQVPDAMARYLARDSHIFSGLKAHAQLLEASRLLTDAQGQRRPYADFEREVLKLNAAYNRNYLEAEYQFATHSAQMAARWVQIEEGAGRYDLQYRTAADDKVRASHQPLHNITLPAEDPFWSQYMPPNGWRCRCTVLEVRKGKHPVTDSGVAAAAGEAATTELDKNGGNRLAMFRFNPGQDKCLMPPANPYTKVAGAAQAQAVVAQSAPLAVPKHTPPNIGDYEKDTGAKVKPEIFEYLGRDTPLDIDKPTGARKSKGYYYSPSANRVTLSVDARSKASKWFAEGVVHHEYGHAADNHNRLRERKELTDLMASYRKKLGKNKGEGYKALEAKIYTMRAKANLDGDTDRREQVLAAADTLMALNPLYGYGHTKAYFKRPGMREAEFLAHAFENKFSGNPAFKEAMPELYDDMVKLVEDFKPAP